MKNSKAYKEIISEKDLRELSKILEFIEDIKYKKNIYPSLKEVAELYAQVFLLKLGDGLVINLEFSPKAFGEKNFREYYQKLMRIKEELLDNNLWLVTEIARHYAKFNKINEIDLIQEGFIGLEISIVKYESYLRDIYQNSLGLEKGEESFNYHTEDINTFSKYAFGTIAGSIIQAIWREEYLRQLPCNLTSNMQKLIQSSISFSEKTGRRPNIIELYELMNTSFESFDAFEDFAIELDKWKLDYAKYEKMPIEDASEIVFLYKTIFSESLDYATIRFAQRDCGYSYREIDHQYLQKTEYASVAWLRGDINKIHHFIDINHNRFCSVIT